jgi:hypothetical protein
MAYSRFKLESESAMPKISWEGTVGLLLEITVGILDHLHIAEPQIIWGLFALGFVLLSDAVIRSDWASKPADSNVRRRNRTLGMLPVIFGAIIFGLMIYARGKVENGTVTESQTAVKPRPQAPMEKSPNEPSPVETPTVKPIPTSKPPTRTSHAKSKNDGTPSAAANDQGVAVGSITQGDGSALSFNQQGGITAGTVNNFGSPMLPTPTVKVCATYPDVVGGEDYKSVITFKTSSQLPRPFFALFFDGAVLEGSAGRLKGSYGYTHMRAEKLPNPERSFVFRTIAMELGGTSMWFPSDGPIQATVPSKSRVKLIRVLGGGGDDPGAIFNVNLVFSCD